MKTYYITLERSKERAQHIQRHLAELHLDCTKIQAVDGKLLTPVVLARECNMQQVESLRWWLTDGAIGCAMSHKMAYQKFLSTQESAAFIVEDDVVLPENIKTILDEISKVIKSNEVILLYYTSFKAAALSRVKSTVLPLSGSGLYYPMNLLQPISATAYCLGRGAAQGILEANSPIEVTADSWEHFFAKGAFDSFQLLYPSTLTIKNFKSSIDYFKKGSVKGWLAEKIDQYKIPLISNFLSRRRKERLDRMTNHFSLTELESPISANLKALNAEKR